MRAALFLKLTWLDCRLFLRNPTAVFWTFTLPVLLLTLMMISFGDERRSLGTATLIIADQDESALSRNLANALTKTAEATQRLEVSVEQTQALQTAAKPDIAILIPVGFEDNVERGSSPVVRMVIRAEAKPAVRVLAAILKQAASSFNTRYAGHGVEPFVFDAEFGIQTSIPYRNYLLNGVIAMTIFSVTLFGFSVQLVSLRESGLLKMFSVFPISPWMYLGAFTANRLLTVVVFVTMLLFGATLIFDVPTVLNIRTFGLYFLYVLVSAATFQLIGLSIASRIRSAHWAVLVANAMYYPVIFVSDLFIPDRTFPNWLSSIASILPLKQLAQSLRRISLDSVVWEAELKTIALLLIWLVLAALFVRTSFVWHARPTLSNSALSNEKGFLRRLRARPRIGEKARVVTPNVGPKSKAG
jgi:ABC-2 type transport system permease protein